MALRDVDVATELVQAGDIVKFHADGFEWNVTATVAWQNLVFLESVIGKRRARAAISAILTAKRDKKTRPVVDNTLEYVDQDWERE